MPREDEDVVLEVFFAPRGSSRAITRATYLDARRIWREYGVSVAVVVHYVEDTLRYYKRDVLSIFARRGVGLLLDPGGFLGESVPLGSYSVGATWSALLEWPSAAPVYERDLNLSQMRAMCETPVETCYV